MKLSFIFELLLIFVLIAFAASAAVGESGNRRMSGKTSLKRRGKIPQNRQTSTNSTANRFCNCSGRMCNCCREFNIPVLPLKGPGCASLQYLSGDRLAISMSFGDRVLTNTTLSGRRPQPVCMPLPGGVSKFCGRVYNIGRQGNEFNACLALELRALNEIEAALRVSCFRFGPKGLRVEPPQPLPILEDEDDDDDDEDDDDVFDYDDADSDYSSFGVLDDDFIGGYFEGESDSSSSNKKKATSTTTAPLRRVTKKPLKPQQKKPLKRKATPKPIKVTTTPKSKPIKISTGVPAIIANETNLLNSTAAQVPNIDKPTSDIVTVPSAILESSTDTHENEVTDSSVLSDVKQEVSTSSPITKGDEDDSDEDDDDSDESSEEDDDEDDPITDVVGEALDDEESAEKTKIPNEKSSNEKPEESKEVLDDIVDSVVDTMTGEGSDESRTLIKGTKSRSGRQSREMRLERLQGDEGAMK